MDTDELEELKTAAFEDVVNKAGTQKNLADLLGVSEQAVGKWKKKGFPVGRCPRIVHFFPNFSLSQLRPDVFACETDEGDEESTAA